MSTTRALVLICVLSAAACSKRDPQPTSTAASAEPASSATRTESEVPVYKKELLSPIWEVDRIYKSMAGPQTTEQFHLIDAKNPELLWIVGFEAVMVEPDGKTQASQEFMCHTNLDVDPIEHINLFGGKKRISGRLFTLSQGQYRIDMPKGFGIPILSTQLVSLNTQVLNLNMEQGKARVRHRVFVDFVRDADLKQPYKALYAAGAYGLKVLRGADGHYGLDATPEGDHGPGCLPGESASEHEFNDDKGRAFTGHWVVKPGREVNHTRVTKIMDLPFDTTLHYVAVHLHPFAESLELKDLTAEKTVYKAFARQTEQGVGLAHVDFFSSAEGVPLFKEHEYEIVSVYNNTTDTDQDSMAVMNLYLLDKEFVKPDLAKVKEALESRPAAPAGSAPAKRGGQLM